MTNKPIKKLTESEELQAIKKHQTGDLKYFLRPFLQFRAYIIFNNKKKMHLYGNEHQCTYSQLLHGRFSNIQLDRLKGYTELINLVEKRYRGLFSSATIYQRTGPDVFNQVCRAYNRNGIIEMNDPVIDSSNQYHTIYYIVHEGRLIIQEEDPAGIDFKTIIDQQLNNPKQEAK